MCRSLWHDQLQSSRFLCQSDGESFPVNCFHGLSYKGSFLKLCASSQLWSALTTQQMNNKFTIVKFFFFFFFFFLHSQMPFMSTAQRLSLLNISLRNNTFCFWDQLVGGWPLFSPPGASIRHAGPGPEPKPGREPEPRHWHTDRRSDPLAGTCPVQDTGQIEGHTEGERRVKVRHDSVTRAAFWFWPLMRERSRARWEGEEGGRHRTGQH